MAGRGTSESPARRRREGRTTTMRREDQVSALIHSVPRVSVIQSEEQLARDALAFMKREWSGRLEGAGG